MKKAILIIAALAIAAFMLPPKRTKALNHPAAATPEPTLIDQKARGDELTEEFHQAYQLSPTGRVSISNINGDVRISVWDNSSVKVDAVKRAYSPARLSEMTIEVTNTADSVKIRTQYPQRERYSGNDRVDNPGTVEYTLTIPRGASLEGAELVNGALDVEGIQGDVNASLVNGKVTASNLSGEVKLSSVNGRVMASGLSGEVKLSTVNGRLEVSLASLGGSKNVTLNSVNGSIVLTIPGGASADVKASTVHGGISNDFGWTVEDGQYVGHNMSGQIGSGGARVRLNNVNGSISVKRGGM